MAKETYRAKRDKIFKDGESMPVDRPAIAYDVENRRVVYVGGMAGAEAARAELDNENIDLYDLDEEMLLPDTIAKLMTACANHPDDTGGVPLYEILAYGSEQNVLRWIEEINEHH